jgi:uncharacterized protein YxjI
MNLTPQCVKYELHRQFAKLVGANFRIYDDHGGLAAFVNQKGFRLKEDIRVYTDETKSQESLIIQARQILDFAAAYDVIDPQTGKVGAFRRKGWTSIVRDEWEVLGVNDEVLGKIIEDSMMMAMLRRYLSNWIPQNFDVIMYDGRRVVDIRQQFNPFLYKLTIDFSDDPNGDLDRRMGMAAAILLTAIEGRQGG